MWLKSHSSLRKTDTHRRDSLVAKSASDQLCLEGRQQVWRGELYNPEIRIALHVPIDIGVGCGLIDTGGSGAAEPGGFSVRGGGLGEHGEGIAGAQDDEDAAGVGVAPAEDGAGSAVAVAHAQRHLHE